MANSWGFTEFESPKEFLVFSTVGKKGDYPVAGRKVKLRALPAGKAAAYFRNKRPAAKIAARAGFNDQLCLASFAKPIPGFSWGKEHIPADSAAMGKQEFSCKIP